MFEFRLINLPDGNQLINEELKTPYSSLTPLEMLEYKEVENELYQAERQKLKEEREAERKQKFTYKLMHKVACMCGIM